MGRSIESNDFLVPIFSAISNFNATATEKALNTLALDLAPRELLYKIALPLMQEVGVRWHKGSLAVAQEHMVSQTLRNALGGLLPTLRPANAPVRMLLATPSNELHEFGILVAAVFASIAHIEPVYLGANLPTKDIILAAKHVNPRIITLASTIRYDSLNAELTELIKSISPTTDLWLAGRACRGLDLSVFGRRVRRMRNFREFEKNCGLL